MVKRLLNGFDRWVYMPKGWWIIYEQGNEATEEAYNQAIE